ncbi:MAG: DnaJ domain-containing protein [Campylobacterota bacterium]|nr:DnaJ domain-containing protein [Campylobacterota bacterium]
MIKRSPYEILGLEGEFTFREIKKAYRKAIRRYPPEQYPETFAEITDAYESLTNEAYFLKNIEDHLYAVDTDLKRIEEGRLDGSRYLKQLFEVPFQL